MSIEARDHTKDKRFINLIVAVVALLMIPFIGMQLSDDVQWSVLDFVVAGTLLTSIGVAYLYLSGKVKEPMHRILLVLVLLGILFVIWAELAVGIFNSPIAGS